MKKTIYRMLLAVMMLAAVKPCFSQDESIRYVEASALMMAGKAKPTKWAYRRMDSTDTRDMPEVIQMLAKRSAGIAILFETNSTIIRARWQLASEVYLPNMTPIGHSGLDLYCLKGGKWQFVSVAKPARGTDQDQVIVQHMDSSMKQFMLYLPLYNTVEALQIGVGRHSVIRPPLQPGINKSRRIVIYGSSVVQGAAASRPGMAYPAILQRRTGDDVINLGFSGSAKMEASMAAYLATVPADCYVLDCIPNPTPDLIRERSYPFIKYLREHQPSVPIILVETIFRQNGYWDRRLGQMVAKQNEEIRKTYERLLREGYRHIYYIRSEELIGHDHEATIDGIHLTDLGFVRITDALMPLIRKALAESRHFH